MTSWWLDTRMLDAGDARGLTRSDTRPAALRPCDMAGDLDAAAKRLGVNVSDLIALRRKVGIAPTHRAPSPLARLAARLKGSTR